MRKAASKAGQCGLIAFGPGWHRWFSAMADSVAISKRRNTSETLAEKETASGEVADDVAGNRLLDR
jgi:hypothetical protein